MIILGLFIKIIMKEASNAPAVSQGRILKKLRNDHPVIQVS